MRKKINILIIITLAFILNINVVKAEVLTVNGSHSNEGELGTNHYTTNINGKSIDLYCKDPGLDLPLGEEAVYEITPISPNTQSGAGLIALMEKSKKGDYTFEQINIAIRFYEYVMGQVNILLSRSQVEKQYEDEFGPIYLVLKNLETAEHYVNRWKNRDDFGAKVNALTVITFDSYRNAFLNEIKNKGYNGRTDWSSSNIGENEEKVYELVKAGIDAAYDFANGDSSTSTNTSFELSHKSDPEDNSTEEYYKKTITYSFKYEGFEYDFDNPDDEDNDSILFTFKCDECDSNADVDYTITINNDESMKITKGDNTKDIELFGNDAYIRTNETDTLTMIIEFTVKKGSDYNCDDKLKYTLDFRYTGEPASDYALYMPTCEKADGSIMSTCIQQELVGDAWQETLVEPEFGGSIGGGNTSSGEDNDDDKYKGKFTQEDEISMCDGDCDELAKECELPDGTIDTSKDKCKDYEQKCKRKCTVHVSDAKCSPNKTNLDIYEGAESEIPCEEAPINVYKCVIDGEDLNKNEYNQKKVEADDVYKSRFSTETIQLLGNINKNDDNPFCKVACIENYHIELPEEQNVVSGRYFQLEVKIGGTKACYTSEINRGNKNIEGKPELVWGSLKADEQEKAKTSYEYLFEVEREKMMLASTLYNFYKNAANAKKQDGNFELTNESIIHYGGDCPDRNCNSGTDIENAICNENYDNEMKSDPCNHDKRPLKYKVNKYQFTYIEYNYDNPDDPNSLYAKNYIPRFDSDWHFAGEDEGIKISDFHQKELKKSETTGQYELVDKKDAEGNYVVATDKSQLFGLVEMSRVQCTKPSETYGYVSCTIEITGTSTLSGHDWDRKDPSMDKLSALKASAKAESDLYRGSQANYLYQVYENIEVKSFAASENNDNVATLKNLITQYSTKMDVYNKQINQCSHWDMGDYTFNPQIKFDYEESYIDNQKVKKQLEALSSSITPEKNNIELCKNLLELENADSTGELPICKAEDLLTDANKEEDRKVYKCEVKEGTIYCTRNTYYIPNSKAASQTAEVKDATYQTPTQYAVLFPSGNVVIPTNMLGDIDKSNMLDNAWPVEWIGTGVVRTYKLYVQDLGEFYNDDKGKLGRIWDSGPNGEPQLTSIVGTVVSTPNICNDPIGSEHRWDVVPTTHEFICGYKINCPDCPSECVPDEGSCGRTDCPSGDCPSPCSGICLMNGDLQLESRPISENKVNTSDRTMGPNWRWEGTIDTAIELKAYQTTKEIEADGEDIFNVFDTSYEGTTTLQNTGQMLVHLDRKTINEIKAYNKSKAYTDDSLVCYDYHNEYNDETYKGIFCYSTFIDEYVAKNVITVPGRPIEAERAAKSQTSGYWTTWDEVVSNSPNWGSIDSEISFDVNYDYKDLSFKSIGIGPAYK